MRNKKRIPYEEILHANMFREHRQQELVGTTSKLEVFCRMGHLGATSISDESLEVL